MRDSLKQSDELVLLNAGDPMNFYAGYVQYDYHESLQLQRDVKVAEGLRAYVSDLLFYDTPIHLTEARLFMTLLQPTPNGMSLMSQLIPIAGHMGPIDIYVKPASVIFPADMPGMAERITDLIKKAIDIETRARAQAAGIALDGSVPVGFRKS